MNEIKVLDKGFVRLVDVLGSDQSIVDTARTSYQKGTKKTSKDRTLIRYLTRHHHSSPSESVTFTFHVKMPLFVRAQWARHRSGRWSWIFSSMNWESHRYSEIKDEFYYPDQLSLQSASNKQGSEGYLEDDQALREAVKAHTEQGYKLYQSLIEKGVAREQARMVVGQNLYAQGYWTISLHNLFHFMRLRSDPHAQYEIRVYSEAIEKIVSEIVPDAYDAWVDYSRDAVSLSKQEAAAVKEIVKLYGQLTLDEEGSLTNLLKSEGLKGRELREALSKLSTEE